MERDIHFKGMLGNLYCPLLQQLGQLSVPHPAANVHEGCAEVQHQD